MMANAAKSLPNMAPLDVCMKENRPHLSDNQRSEVIRLIKEVLEYEPFHRDSLNRWKKAVSEYWLIVDPDLTKTPEAKQILNNKEVPGRKSVKSHLRSNAEKYVGKYLTQLVR
jgi:hypothetical protein